MTGIVNNFQINNRFYRSKNVQKQPANNPVSFGTIIVKTKGYINPDHFPDEITKSGILNLIREKFDVKIKSYGGNQWVEDPKNDYTITGDRDKEIKLADILRRFGFNVEGTPDPDYNTLKEELKNI